MQESGMPGFDISNWFAYFVPAGTPPEVIAKLNAEVNRALKLQDVREKLANVGAEVVGTSPQELQKFVQAESEKYARVIKASGAKGTD
jgi:tripartite-type tricarboxylate transporter receptor subunit TctC